MTELDILTQAIDRYRDQAMYEPDGDIAQHLYGIANAMEMVRDDILDQKVKPVAKKHLRARRTAPGRRVVLVRAKNRKEALAATKLMVQHLMRNCKDDEELVQSFYLDVDGTAWFG